MTAGLESKANGNGCVEDFSRKHAARIWPERLAPDVMAIMSGGTEGVFSPHVTVLSDDGGRDPNLGKGQVVVVGTCQTPKGI